MKHRLTKNLEPNFLRTVSVVQLPLMKWHVQLCGRREQQRGGKDREGKGKRNKEQGTRNKEQGTRNKEQGKRLGYKICLEITVVWKETRKRHLTCAQVLCFV